MTRRPLPSALLLLGILAVARAANPVLPGADPHLVIEGGTYWLYPTWSEGGGREAFFAFSSTNRADWTRHGPVLSFADVPWMKDDGRSWHGAWAPSVLRHGAKWYFYYSAGPQHPTPSRIGVAVGDSPAGPFRDSGRPLLTGYEGFEAIDPIAFIDPKSGRRLLYAGGSAGSKLRAFELGPDLVSLAGEIPMDTPPEFTEGVFLHERDGRYYLSYSHGDYRTSAYSVHYAMGTSPAGPWVYEGPVLVSDATRKGPGHHAFARDERTGAWWIAYHRWEGQTGDGPYRGVRQICLDRVEYDAAGRILPVRMTGGAGSP